MSFCGTPAPAWEWTKHTHALIADVPGATCIHCGLRVPTERARFALTTACPCHLLRSAEGEIFEGSIMLRGVLALRASWHAWYRCVTPSPGPSPPLPLALVAPPRSAFPFLPSYRDHFGLPIRADGGHICLMCGALARDNRRGFSLKRDGVCKGQLAALTHVAASAILCWQDEENMPGGRSCVSRMQEWSLLREACRALNGGPIDPPPSGGGFIGGTLPGAYGPWGFSVGASACTPSRTSAMGASHRHGGAIVCPAGQPDLARNPLAVTDGAEAGSHSAHIVHPRAAMFAALCPPCGGHPGSAGGGGSAWLHLLGARAHVRAAQQGRRSRSPRRRLSSLDVVATGSSRLHSNSSSHLAGWRRLWDLDARALCLSPSVQ